MTLIGYNDGIAAEYNRLRDMDPGGTILKKDSKGKWLPLSSLDSVPLDDWKAYDKAERRARILKDDHDAAISGGGSPDPPDPPPAQGYLRVAPITVREEGGSDQMVCLWAGAPGDVNHLQPGVVRLASGEFTDDSGAKYAADGDGRENSAVRSKVTDPALVGARSMDGRSACECPPVGDPTKNTGSWTV
jgi:hypothetical protein